MALVEDGPRLDGALLEEVPAAVVLSGGARLGRPPSATQAGLRSAKRRVRIEAETLSSRSKPKRLRKHVARCRQWVQHGFAAPKIEATSKWKTEPCRNRVDRTETYPVGRATYPERTGRTPHTAAYPVRGLRARRLLGARAVLVHGAPPVLHRDLGNLANAASRSLRTAACRSRPTCMHGRFTRVRIHTTKRVRIGLGRVPVPDFQVLC